MNYGLFVKVDTVEGGVHTPFLLLRLGGPSAKARLGRGSLDHLMEAKP